MSIEKKAANIAIKVRFAKMLIPAPARELVDELVALVMEMAQEIDKLKGKTNGDN